MPETKTCRDCRSAMPVDAVKCSSCGSFQNWRRHFTLTATLVSFFLGAAAAAGIVLPPLRDWLRPEVAISVERIGVTALGYTVLVRNEGSAVGVVKYVHANYGDQYTALESSIGNRVIQAGESRAITMSLPQSFARHSFSSGDFAQAMRSDDPPRDCNLLFVLAVAGEEVWVTIDEANGCFDFFDFLRGRQTVG